jgi:hypothetical protein
MSSTLAQLDHLSSSRLQHFAYHSVSGYFLGLVLGTVLTRHRFRIGLYSAGLGGGFSLSETWKLQRSMLDSGVKDYSEQIEYINAMHMLLHLMD